MIRQPFILAFVLLTVFISACKKDVSLEPAILKVNFKATMNGQSLQFNQVFEGPEGHRMLVEDFSFHLSDITIIGSSGQKAVKEIALIDFTAGKTGFEMELPAGTYKQLIMGFGVPPTLNGIGISGFDPAKYPADHPLSIFNGMYWTSETGYVFLRVQGKIDTSASQNKPLLYSWFYHVGLNELYESRTFNKLNMRVEAGANPQLDFVIELNDLFRMPGDTIRIPQESFTHTTDHFNLAARVMRNFRHAVRLP